MIALIKQFYSCHNWSDVSFGYQLVWTHTDTDTDFSAFPLDSVIWNGMVTNLNSELSAS